MYELRPYQVEARDAVLSEWEKGHQKTLLVLPTGCHAEGEKLLMADGTCKAVEDIRLGDRLIGADGMARNVLHVISGIDELYRIVPIKGKPFTVTGNHKLTLIRTNECRKPIYPCERRGGEIIDVTVHEWLTWSENRKHLYKLIRSGPIRNFPDYENPELPIDPYFLGVLIGDGCLKRLINVTTPDPEIVEELVCEAKAYDMHLRAEAAGLAKTYYFVTNRGRGNWKEPAQLYQDLEDVGLRNKCAGEKMVPAEYKYGSIDVRLNILAGLIDTDGSYSNGGYDYISKSKQLSDDVAFISRSCGLSAYVKECTKGYGDIFKGTYYRVSIYGHCERIPCRVKRKKSERRKQIKNVLRTGFHVEPAGSGKYYGFTVDGDNRYLLDDFTITHNCGKSVVFASVVQQETQDGSRALIMAHRGELLTQAADKLQKACGISSALEKADSTSLGSMFPVTVGSVQSLSQPKRLARFPADYFKTIVVDEAHHCLSDSYQRVLEHFPEANVLGVTATPDRGDKKALSQYFDSQAYEYSMTRAIREGYLVPIKAQMIPLELDIEDIGISNGDYAAGDIGNALDPYLGQIAQEMCHYCHGRKTVVFLPLIATSQKLCKLLNEVGLKAAEVNGGSEDREEILADFEAGKYDVLCNSMLLTEGWDCPAVDCVVVLRPTRVRSLYQQMVGRGMRLSPGKDHLLLLDFLWLTERHDLCRPSSLVGKDANIASRMDEKLSKDDQMHDLIEAEEEAERDVLTAREEALARELHEMRKRKRKLVDPIQYALSIAAEDLANYTPTFAWEMGPPTEKQLAYLENRGIDAHSVANAGMASMLIDRLRRRQMEGLATPKQIRCLERYGFRQVGTWMFTEASRMISALANNNWRIPYGVKPSTYAP